LNRRRQLGFILLATALVMLNDTIRDPTEVLEAVPFDQLPGWREDDHAAALAALKLSCQEISGEGRGFDRPIRYGGGRAHWLELCSRLDGIADARAFFEKEFVACRVNDPDRPEGLFTGYYEPEAEGSRVRTPEYQVPIYRRPGDLVGFDAAEAALAGAKYGRRLDGKPTSYFTRQEIEQGALAGRGLEIAWLRGWADAFFIHIQGSGRVKLSDGSVIRLAFSAKSGQPYTGIGGVLVDRGVFPREKMSMQTIRHWMSQNPDAARGLMWENKSFIFFREVDLAFPGLGPPGAQQVQLTPERSLAVDRALWAFGTPVWLDAETPSGPSGAPARFRRLLIAQDTGTAIRGLARGDVFWGAGPRAARIAGHMKASGRMTVLLPRAVAAEIFSRQ